MKIRDIFRDTKFEYGDCDAEVYHLAKKAITHKIPIVAVRGFAWIPANGKLNDEDAHSWIEVDGKIHDPTINQFDNQIRFLRDHHDVEVSYHDIKYNKEREYTPEEFIKEYERYWGRSAK